MSTRDVKYPEVTVQLSRLNRNANAIAIVNAVTRELKQAGHGSGVINKFRTEALSSDYDNVIQTATKYVNIT